MLARRSGWSVIGQFSGAKVISLAEIFRNHGEFPSWQLSFFWYVLCFLDSDRLRATATFIFHDHWANCDFGAPVIPSNLFPT